ncbi:MAG: hypothetical protein AAF723_06635, partial [Pseudomonadota bacterium]
GHFRLQTLTIEGVEITSLPQDQAPQWYARLGRKAAKDSNWPLTLAAAQVETRIDSDAYGAWQRLAYGEAQQAGTLTRESLRALLTAYEIAPFPPPTDIVWRVEFAAQYWPAMPDIIQEKTLSQIDVLGRIRETWPTRVRWCETFPDGALAQAACETLPDHNRVFTE